MEKLGYLGTLTKRTQPKVQIQQQVVVEVPTAPFLSDSESAQPVTQSTSLVEVAGGAGAAASQSPFEERCASPPALASTASSHTEESSE